MKLSIIIPVYQVEHTLERCVESILQQKFRDYQIILVDDASPDGSPQLCDDLARRDHRIIVIHRKKNGGLSASRNNGIARAKGEYITFVDSDDYLSGETLKPLMDLLAVHHDYDILEYSAYLHFGRPGSMSILRLDNREYGDMRQYWYETKAYVHTYAWNKIYRRTLFNADTRFPEGRKFEDVFMLPQLLAKCQVIATTSLGYYYYCYNAEGITAQASGNDLHDLLDAHLLILNGKTKQDLTPPTTDYYSKVLNVALDVYEKTGTVPQLPPIKKVLAQPKLSAPLPYGIGEERGTPFKIRMLNIFGLKTLCRINKLMHQISRRRSH